MRILLVNDYGTPTGGAEILLIALRAALRARGHDARLFTSSARPHAVQSQADYECLGTTSSFRALLQTFNPWAYWSLRKVVSEFQPDIVHVGLFLTQLSPLVLLALRGVPALYFAMWYRTICPIGTKLLPNGAICHKSAGTVCFQSGCLPLRDFVPLMIQQRLLHRWKDAFRLIVAHSSSLQRRLTAEGIPVDEVITGFVPGRVQRPPLSDPPTAAFVGRLVPEKGVDTLLQAFARVLRVIPEARLEIIGDGPARRRLTELRDELNLADAVSLLGQMPRDAVENIVTKAWVQAIPSRWEEPFGLSAADAMMRGTAVVLSRTCGIAEWVDEGQTGLLVSSGNPEELADALMRVLGDKEFAERLGTTSREIALSHFKEDLFVDRFLHAYQRILTGSVEHSGVPLSKDSLQSTASEKERHATME